jgi:hypothetical protein
MYLKQSSIIILPPGNGNFWVSKKWLRWDLWVFRREMPKALRVEEEVRANRANRT